MATVGVTVGSVTHFAPIWVNTSAASLGTSDNGRYVTLGVASRATGSAKSVLVAVGALVQQPDGFCRSVRCQQVAPAWVMQVLRLLLGRGI